MVTFERGDRVRIARSSVYYQMHGNSNPRGVLGTVTHTGIRVLPLKVKWDNGSTNAYKEHDLVLAEGVLWT